MKIGLVHSIYGLDFRGGSDIVFANVVSALKNEGHDLFVVALGHKDIIEESNGVKVYRLKPFNIFNFLDIDKQSIWKRFIWRVIDVFNDVQVLKLYRILKKEQPQFVYSQGLVGVSYWLPRLLQALGISQAYRVYDMQLINPSGQLYPDQKLNFIESIYCALVRLIIGSPDNVIFPTNFIQKIHDGYGFFKKSNKSIIGNPLADQSIRLARTDDDKNINLLFLGQVIDHKGIIELVSAVNLLKNEKVYLHVAGIGPALEEVKKIAQDNKQVIFYGQLNHQELMEKVWPKIDLLIAPSKLPESFGMMIIEAYAQSVPVLAAEVGAFLETVEPDKTGWFLSKVEPETIKEALEKVINENKITPEIRQNCLAKAKEYSPEKYAAKILALAKK